MAHPLIETTVKDRICILTLNDPDRLNPMTDAMAVQFEEAIAGLRADNTLKVLIITGAGRAFSAGGDLEMIARSADEDPGILKQKSFAFYNRFLGIRRLGIPTIAAVNGHAVGAGACLALACNMRLASDAAKIGFPFARLGLHPGMGAEYLLLNLAGEAKTFELLMTGDILPADEARRIGLFNNVIPDNALMDGAMALAGKICAMPDLPIRMMMDSIPAARTATLEQALHRQAAYQAVNYKTPDFKEGISALMERRKPRFTGQY